MDILFNVTVQPPLTPISSTQNGTYFCNKVGEDMENPKELRSVTCTGTNIKVTVHKDATNRSGKYTCVLRRGDYLLSATVTLSDGPVVRSRVVYLYESISLICETSTDVLGIVWKKDGEDFKGVCFDNCHVFNITSAMLGDAGTYTCYDGPFQNATTIFNVTVKIKGTATAAVTFAPAAPAATTTMTTTTTTPSHSETTQTFSSQTRATSASVLRPSPSETNSNQSVFFGTLFAIVFIVAALGVGVYCEFSNLKGGLAPQ